MATTRKWLQPCARLAVVIALSGLTANCKTVQGGPDRLYTLEDEVIKAQAIVQDLSTRYYGVPASDGTPPPRLTEADLKFYRNEVIARRMYIIDVEYSEYESALTRERQQIGFLTQAAAQGLNVAATLTTPEHAAKILAGLAGGISAVRGYYDSEVIIAKTIQIAQGQMRALRDEKAKQIQIKMTFATDVYPLSSALHDLEDYYRAGTITAGLIKAVGEAGTAAQIAAISKDATFTGTYERDDSSDVLQNYIAPGGKPNTARIRTLNGLLLELGYKVDVRTIIDAKEAAPIRAKLISYAATRGIDVAK